MSFPHVRVLMLWGVCSGLVGGLVATVVFGSSIVAQSASTDKAEAEIPKTLSAQEFRLIDSQGRMRAVLAFAENGQPYFQLRDEFDTYRVWIGISSDTGVALRDVDGKTRLVLSVDEQGDPSLIVRDRQHRTKSFHP